MMDFQEQSATGTQLAAAQLTFVIFRGGLQALSERPQEFDGETRIEILREVEAALIE